MLQILIVRGPYSPRPNSPRVRYSEGPIVRGPASPRIRILVLDLFHKSSDHRALGPSGPRTIGPSDHRTTGPSDYRALGIPGHNRINIEVLLHLIEIITKTCPYSIWRFFSAVKIENFNGKILIFLIFLLKI